MPRSLFLLSTLLWTLVLTTSAQAQQGQWVQPYTQPNQNFATSTPFIPDSRYDSNSMSPDSWDTSQTPPQVPLAQGPTVAVPHAVTPQTAILQTPAIQPLPVWEKTPTPAILSSNNQSSAGKQFHAAGFQSTVEPEQQTSPSDLLNDAKSSWTQPNPQLGTDLESPITVAEDPQTAPQVPATFQEVPPVPQTLLPTAPVGIVNDLHSPTTPEFQQYSPIFQQPAGDPKFDSLRYQGIVSETYSQPGTYSDVGHRYGHPINRNVESIDDGTKFDFEQKKKEFPPFNEIIATGRFFYSADIFWVEPNFQGNTAIATQGPDFGDSIAFDFDSDFQPRFKAGFESEFGPGIELTYFNLNSNSELASFTSSGGFVGFSESNVNGQSTPSRIFADNIGETLVAQHSIDIDSFTVSFFKDLKFPVSRINGNFGFHYVNIAQELNANVTDAGGGIADSLASSTDLRAWGPRVILEYFRPIGHTPLELSTSFGGSVLFGQRDQFVANSATGQLNRTGADEFLTLIDFAVTLQYVKNVGENRNIYGRFGFVNQTWIGGGTAAFPQGDFGIRGLTFGIGYNR